MFFLNKIFSSFKSESNQKKDSNTDIQIDKTKYDRWQMREIRTGVEEGLDVSKYADPSYNSEQMKQIRIGLKRGLDVSVYADPSYNFEQMDKLRLELQASTGKYDNLTNIDKDKFSLSQLDIILLGVEEGLDVSKYADPRYDSEQMDTIRFGLEEGVDVSKYADPKYNEGQMMEICLGMMSNIDINIYADPKYKWDQMFNIRIGLEEGLDISQYIKPKDNCEDICESKDNKLLNKSNNYKNYSMSINSNNKNSNSLDFEDIKTEMQQIERIKQFGKYAVLNNDYTMSCKIKDVKISNDGNLIAASSKWELPKFEEYWDMESYYDEGPHTFVALRIWKYGTFEILKEFTNIDVIDIEFSKDSNIFAMAYQNKDECGGDYCSSENHIDILETKNFTTISSITLEEEEYCCGIAISNDSKYISIRICKSVGNIKKEHYIKIFDITTCKKLCKIKLEEEKYYYKSSIMRFSYDDKFLIFTLDKDYTAYSSALAIVDISKRKVKSRIDSVVHKSIDIGNISNKLVYFAYQTNESNYWIIDLDTDDSHKISDKDGFISGSNIAKFNLDDSKVVINGFYSEDSSTDFESYTRTNEKAEACISLFDTNNFKYINTIDLNKVIGHRVKEINHMDVNRYDEFLVYSSDYKKYDLSCFNFNELKLVFTKNIPSSLKQIGSNSTCYCRDKEIIAFNRFYSGSYDHTCVFSTYEEALNILQDVDREYFNYEKYKQPYDKNYTWVQNL